MTDMAAVDQRRHWRPITISIALAPVRWFLALVFIASGVAKLWNLADFALAVYNYRILPHWLVGVVAVVLPGVEAVAGAGLLSRRLRTASSAVIAGLCAVFVGAVSAAMVRGLNIECGCFSVLEERRVGLGLLTQDMVLLALACYCVVSLSRNQT